MKTIHCTTLFHKSVEVRLFSSIKELTIARYHEFQKLVMQDMGVGSTMESVNKHLSMLNTLLINEKYQEAKLEATNLHNNFYMMTEKINILSYCFMAFVHSINGVEVTDLSEEGVKEKINYLISRGLKVGQVEDVVEEIKKNLKKSFDLSLIVAMELK